MSRTHITGGLQRVIKRVRPRRISAVLALAVLCLFHGEAIAQRKTCVDCHKNFEDVLSKEHVHSPAKESCETCHKRHGFAQKLVLVKGLPELCVDCHDGLQAQLESPYVHEALTRGGCTVCHEPHAADNAALMRQTDEGRSACLLCHDGLTAAMQDEQSHAPFREGKCESCHAPHGSDQPNLLLASEAAVCEKCHAESLEQHSFAGAGDFACSDCHDPHGSSQKRPTARYAHTPFASGECDACHDLEDGEITIGDGFPETDLCEACHDDKSGIITGEASHFGTDALREGGTATCLECHGPHSTKFGRLMLAEQGELCARCHDDLPSKKSYRGLLHPPFANGDCTECHEPHGGGGEHHLTAESPTAVCITCHEDVAKPEAEGETRHDALDLVECTDCHESHASHTAALLTAGSRELCATCHDHENFAAPHPPYSAGTCTACHKNHSRQAGLLSAPVNTVCLSCHQEVAASMRSSVEHPAVSEDACDSCHRPHGSNHKGLLAEKQDDLCLGCHDLSDLVVATTGQDPVLHAPVANGQCANCHDPHGSPRGALLVRDGGNLCYSCHDQEKISFAEGNVHPPVAEGQCNACHTPHGSPSTSLTLMAEPALCTQCHDFAKPPLAGSHSGLDPTSVTCTACHSPHNSPVDNLLNPVVHEPFADGDCSTCHEGEKGPGGMALANADICASCHDDKESGTGHQHVEGTTCTNCHSPHAARFASLLPDVNRLCSSCHDDIVNPARGEGGTVRIHQPILDGSCLKCHNLHDSPAEGFLVEEQGSLCKSCHESIADRESDASQHDPFAKGKCSSCHETHASAVAHLLKKGEENLCKTCHGLGTAEMAAAHNSIPLTGRACTTCHDPHTTAKAATKLVLPDLHAPYSDGDCSACHGADGVVPRALSTCTDCHDEANSYAAAHGAGRTGQDRGTIDMCLDCHSPHAGHGHVFRRSGEAETCYQCHDRKAFFREVVHPVLEDGCSTCHDVHENNFADLSGARGNELCLGCHDASSQHAHPLGEAYKDPRTGGPLVCVSCHEAHSSDHEYMLSFDRRRDLCVQCHQSGTMDVH